MTNTSKTLPPLDVTPRWYIPQENHWAQLAFRAELNTQFPALGIPADSAAIIADLRAASAIATHADLHNSIQNHRVGDGGLFGVALTYYWRENDYDDDKLNQHMQVVASESSKVWPFPRPGDPT